VTVCDVRVIQALPLRRCNETVRWVNGAPLAVSWPVIEKDCLTWAEGGAEMVRVVGIWVELTVAVGVFASTAGAALQNNNAQTTNTTATTITILFSAYIFPTLEHEAHTRAARLHRALR